MNNKYLETIATWNKIAGIYEEKFMDLNLYDDSYDSFCDSLEIKNARVLDIGCGPGNITRYLLRRNPSLRIMGIDTSEKMIELAAKNNPQAEFKVLNCLDISSFYKKYNGLIGGFVIPYLSPEDCSTFITQCSEILQSKGLLYLSFVDGDPKNSGFISTNSGDRTYFYYHPLNSIKKDLEKNGFEVSAPVLKPFTKSNGESESHTILLAVLKK